MITKTKATDDTQLISEPPVSRAETVIEVQCGMNGLKQSILDEQVS